MTQTNIINGNDVPFLSSAYTRQAGVWITQPGASTSQVNSLFSDTFFPGSLKNQLLRKKRE